MMVIGVGIDLPLKKLKKNHHPCVTMKRNLQTVEGSDNTKRKSFTFRFQRSEFAAVYMGNGFDRPSCGVIRSLPYPPGTSVQYGVHVGQDHRDRNGLNRFRQMFLAVHDLRISHKRWPVLSTRRQGQGYPTARSIARAQPPRQ